MPPDRTLIICRGPQEAHHQRTLLDPKQERFMFTWPGTGLHGHRFHTIIVSAAIREDIRHTMPLASRALRYDQYTKWLEEIRCRLGRDGVMIEI